MRKFELHRVIGEEGKGLVLERTEQGQYIIAFLARTKDNNFNSIAEVERAVGYKLELIEEEYYPDE